MRNNRIIKFRGFSTNFTNGNEWFYGSFVKLGDSFYILEDDSKIWDIYHDGVIVDEKTVGEFTGLHDKNGKEIYEGDVLKRYKKNGDAYLKNDIVEISIFQNDWANNIIEKVVIGNVFENPDLIKF